MKKKTDLSKKTGQNIKKTGAFLSENKKEVLYVGGAVFLLLIGYKVYKSLNNNNNPLADKIEKVKINLKINLSKATITKQDAQKYAQQLLYACDYANPFYGTDSKTIKKVFEKLKTADDFKLVYEAFGLKKYNGYGLPPEGFFRHLDNAISRDLVYWLRAELSPRDGEVYKMVKDRIESAEWTF